MHTLHRACRWHRQRQHNAKLVGILTQRLALRDSSCTRPLHALALDGDLQGYWRQVLSICVECSTRSLVAGDCISGCPRGTAASVPNERRADLPGTQQLARMKDSSTECTAACWHRTSQTSCWLRVSRYQNASTRCFTVCGRAAAECLCAAWLVQGLFVLHNKQCIHATVVALNAADGSDVRGHIQSRADQFVDVSAMSDHEAAATLHSYRWLLHLRIFRVR